VRPRAHELNEGCRTLCLIGDDRNKVICNDSHIVAIDRKHLDGFGSSIDQSKSVFLASCEFEFRYTRIADAVSCIVRSKCRAIKIVSSVDEVVDRLWCLIPVSGIDKG